MTMKVSVAEAKARLSELLREVETGERVVVERRGRPVALLRAYDREKDGEEPSWFERLNGALADTADFEGIMSDILAARRGWGED